MSEGLIKLPIKRRCNPFIERVLQGRCPLFIVCFCLFMGLTAQAESFQSMVSDTVMQKIYEEIKTPYKYGLVLVPQDSTKKTDCPTVFRHAGKWYMSYLVFAFHSTIVLQKLLVLIHQYLLLLNTNLNHKHHYHNKYQKI